MFLKEFLDFHLKWIDFRYSRKGIYNLSEGIDRVDVDPFHDTRLSGVLRGEKNPFKIHLFCGNDHGKNPLYRPQETVQGQFTEKNIV